MANPPRHIKESNEIMIFRCKKCNHGLTSGKANYCGGCYTDNPEIRSELRRYPTGEEVTEVFWDCKCDLPERIHHNSYTFCFKCETKQKGAPKSIKDEVINYYL